MKYRHLFWDFDGTLYDSYPQINRAMAQTLKAFGFPAQPAEEMRRMLKVSVSRALAVYAERFGESQDRLHERFHEYHMQEGFFPPYPGLRACMTRLHNAGARHYLYTHRDRRAWEQLDRDGLRGLFEGGVTSEDNFPLKPAPDALLHLMAQGGLCPADCAMIGDRDIDIISGQNAGMAGILFDPEGFYPMLQAEGRARDMDALCALLLKA